MPSKNELFFQHTYIGCVNWTPHYSFEHQDAHMRLVLQVYLGSIEFSAGADPEKQKGRWLKWCAAKFLLIIH